MDIKEFKVGQTAFILNMNKGRNKEPSIIETTVETIGRKYLTISNGRRYTSTENPFWVQETGEWGAMTLLCPTKEDVHLYIEKRELEKWLVQISWTDVKKYSLRQLKQVKEILGTEE